MRKFWGTLRLITGIIIIVIGFISIIKETTLSSMDTTSRTCYLGCFVLLGGYIAANGMADITYNPNDSFGSH